MENHFASMESDSDEFHSGLRQIRKEIMKDTKKKPGRKLIWIPAGYEAFIVPKDTYHIVKNRKKKEGERC